jgi:hypothetical protein
MPIEVKDLTDSISGSGVMGGIVALVTTFGWWVRKERSEKAKTIADVSASNASASASDSQASQIEALTKRANEQGEAIIHLMSEISSLKKHVARLDAGRVGASTLLKAVHLCKECEEKYGPILDEIGRLLSDDVDTTI